MAYETDERLKGYLDTNQLCREQLCLAILALDKRFSHVKPRHPRGGPDGGRDIEAMYRGIELAYGAVGFTNQAADVDEKKRTIRIKFGDDLDNALNANPRPSVFIFFTNVNFTIGEKSGLDEQARAKGFSHCEIFDRERLRVALDSPDGFAARHQFLSIPMSESEQASFFAKWGDDIQSIITTGFQEVHSTLSQLLFLQEAERPLSGLHVHFKFDREYDASEIVHFRAFCSIYLSEPKLDIWELLIGKTDKADRFRTDIEERDIRPGIALGIASGQWKLPWSSALEPDDSSESNMNDDNYFSKYVNIGCGSGIGKKTIKDLVVSYNINNFLRFEPVLSLIDFDEARLIPIMNKSLAEKLECIRVFANGYMLLDLDKKAFLIDSSEFKLGLREIFSQEELSDPWVRIRSANYVSALNLSFANNVPVRMFKSSTATLVEPNKRGNQ